MQYLDSVSRDTLVSLINSAKNPSISIYSPMIIKGKETEQNAIRYKNLLNKAESSSRNWAFAIMT